MGRTVQGDRDKEERYIQATRYAGTKYAALMEHTEFEKVLRMSTGISRHGACERPSTSWRTLILVLVKGHQLRRDRILNTILEPVKGHQLQRDRILMPVKGHQFSGEHYSGVCERPSTAINCLENTILEPVKGHQLQRDRIMELVKGHKLRRDRILEPVKGYQLRRDRIKESVSSKVHIQG
ncbi:UNVERIFIED_CONTAM: hypothetical protein Sindi_0737600 [Sesamum indicum]